MSALTTINTLLPTASSSIVEALADLISAQLINRLGGEDAVDEVPEELEYIVVNVTLARYNQMGDEGKNASTVEGESATWMTDLFAPYEDDIQKYLDRTNSTTSGVSIKFL